MFGSPTVFGSQTTSSNPMKDYEVVSPPDDTIQALAFSPSSVTQNFLISGSWDNCIRCWEVQQSGQTVPKAQNTHQGPVLDVCWSDDGSKVFSASADKTVNCWDLGSNQFVQVAQHDAPVKTVHWMRSPNYACIITGSWDKTLKFWDTRQSNPMLVINLPDKCYCADVMYPMAVVGTAGRRITVYQLEGQPQEFKTIESPLKYQHRSVSIFKDKQETPTGFALGSVEGRVAIQYVTPQNPKDNFTFKCHRSNGTNNGYQDIYAVALYTGVSYNSAVSYSECLLRMCGEAIIDTQWCRNYCFLGIYRVNDISFHPVHGTLATVGSDGRFSFWDKDARTKLKTSDQMDQPITRSAFNANGQVFAYALGYDWSKGHEFATPQKKNAIYLHPCFEELKPRNKA